MNIATAINAPIYDEDDEAVLQDAIASDLHQVRPTSVARNNPFHQDALRRLENEFSQPVMKFETTYPSYAFAPLVSLAIAVASRLTGRGSADRTS